MRGWIRREDADLATARTLRNELLQVVESNSREKSELIDRVLESGRVTDYDTSEIRKIRDEIFAQRWSRNDQFQDMYDKACAERERRRDDRVNRRMTLYYCIWTFIMASILYGNIIIVLLR